MESRIFIVPEKGYTFSAEDKQRIEAHLKKQYGPDVEFAIFDGEATVGDYEPFISKYEAPAKETPCAFYYGLSVLHGDIHLPWEWMDSMPTPDNNGSLRPVYCGPAREELGSRYNLPYSYSVIPRPYSCIHNRYPSIFQFNNGK